jgi:hypothetical protein
MNKVVVVRPACRAVAEDSAGLPTGRRVKRRLQMHLASPTSPAHVVVFSDIMKKSFSATCEPRKRSLWLTGSLSQVYCNVIRGFAYAVEASR